MKIGLISLGCPKNLVDSEVMLGLAQEAGHDLTNDPADADVLVVNTCAFIDRAKQESVDAILEMAGHKTEGRCRRLIVTGCLAERYREELKREIPEIDVVLGTGEVPAIVSAIDPLAPAGCAPSPAATDVAPVRLFPPRRAQTDAGPAPPSSEVRGSRIAARHREAAAVRELPTYIYDAGTPRVLATPRHFAYVKIAEGCDYNCAFCIIPTLRGQYRSRAVESIVAEANQLAARGVKELLLISQDTSFFGTDRRDRGALPRLLRELNGVDGLEWIRLLYLYPTTISDEVLDAMAELPKVCRYVDLPLQHAADGVLKRMRRPGTGAGYERLIERIRSRVPGVTIRTTVIVGFPGETREDFQALVRFIRNVEFDHLGVFRYSHEEGTAAYHLADDVPAAEKARRERHLMKVQQQIVSRRHASRVGARVRVLVDGPAPDHPLVLAGRLEGQAPDIDPVVYLTDCGPDDVRIGALCEAEIVEARGYDLVARPL